MQCDRVAQASSLCWLRPLTFDPCSASAADYATGFGGRYGVQADRVDKSAVGFEYQAKTEKHESQKGALCACVCVR